MSDAREPAGGAAVSDARALVLGRVRAALRDVPRDERPQDVAVVRDYRRQGALAAADVLALFAERCADYGTSVRAVAPAEVGTAVADVLARRGSRRVVVPAGVPAAWTGAAGPAIAWIPDDGLSASELDATDAVLTGCAVAIAETGTLVLDGGGAQGRRALTLVPDHHLCVVAAEQIVELVPEALARVDPRRPLTFASGCSATSDIELERVAGVHGPRTLDVLVVRGDA